VEVLAVVSESELEWHRHEDRLKAQRDAASLQYGLQTAKQRGELVARIRLSQRLLKEPELTNDQVRMFSFRELTDMAAELDRLLLPQPVFRQAMEVLRGVSESEIERHRYEDRLKAQRDAASLQYAAQHAHRHGFEEGLEQGREQGLERGQLAGRIRLCQQLLQQPLLSEDEVRQLSLEQLTELAGKLEQQLLARQPAQ
jgi:flagellar biosynthesis/type III secretory pathway protein FliH